MTAAQLEQFERNAAISAQDVVAAEARLVRAVADHAGVVEQALAKARQDVSQLQEAVQRTLTRAAGEMQRLGETTDESLVVAAAAHAAALEEAAARGQGEVSRLEESVVQIVERTQTEIHRFGESAAQRLQHTSTAQQALVEEVEATVAKARE